MPWGLKLREQVACVPDHASQEVPASSGFMGKEEAERGREGDGREGRRERTQRGFQSGPSGTGIAHGSGWVGKWVGKTLAVRDDERAQMVLTGNSNAFINHG